MGAGKNPSPPTYMEQKIGRYLDKSEHVHHINGVRDDNRIENLKLLTESGHHKLHYHFMCRKTLFSKCEECGSTEIKLATIKLCRNCYAKQ